MSGQASLEPLPEAVPGLPEVRLLVRTVPRLQPKPASGTSYLSQGRALHSSLRRHAIRIRIDDALHFTLLLHRGTILCLATAEASGDRVRYWFLQKILPAYRLLCRQVEILHGAAVEVEGRVAGFLAPSGTGKSTLLDCFVARGHTLFADEHLLVHRGTTLAVPTIPYLRPRRQVESLGDRTPRFQTSPRLLGCLYLLEQAAPEECVAIRPVHGSECAALLGRQQQFNLRGLRFTATMRPMLAERFADLARLSKAVPLRRIRIPRSLERLPEVYAAILHDMQPSPALPPLRAMECIAC